MNCLRRLSTGHYLSLLALIGALLTAACERHATETPVDFAAGEVRTFTGTWSATGNQQTIQLESGHQARIFRLTGSLLLSGKQRLSRGFKADLIGFSDNLSGSLARCVWTDERGDKVFSQLHGAGKVAGELIEGRILGGTGRYAKLTGEYTFRFKRMTYTDNGAVSGRVVDLKGWVREATSAAATTTGDRQ